MNQMKISRTKPGTCWQEGMLLGNGRIGAVLYGGVEEEVIELTDACFWSGDPFHSGNQPGAAEAFKRMRKAVAAGDFPTSMEAAEGFIGIRGNYGTSLPVGSLHIKYLRQDLNEEEPYTFNESLDLREGVASLCTEQDQFYRKRDAFVSHPDDAFYYHGKCSGKQEIEIMLKERETAAYPMDVTVDTQNQQLLFATKAIENIHTDGTSGTHLKGVVKVILKEGEVETGKDRLLLKNVHEFWLVVSMKCDANLRGLPMGIDTKATTWIACEEAHRRHIEDFSSYMNRIDFSLDENDQMSETMFQFGRYLLLSSSREDSPLPAHLQGVWNDNVACRIGWACDMHLDINTQMNYWLAEGGNLSECTKPLFNWIINTLVPNGRIAARESYGLPGWSADLVSNAWGYAAPYWAREISPCPTGGIWVLSAMWEHWLYTKDVTFLKEKLYPLLWEAVSFFAEYVFWDSDRKGYTSGPSISPENHFITEAGTFYFSNGCTYELVMIRGLFAQFLDASKELGYEDRVKEVSEKLENLIPFRILEDGTLAEFSHPYPSGDLNHRHTSHLLGLFPYNQIDRKKTPELAQAVKASIQARLTPKEKWEDTGWARSLLILYFARLGDEQEAYYHVKQMQEQLTGDNLLVMHPPTRGAQAFQEVYELDGNTGFSMGVMEMIVQSQNGVIELLPALPKKWKSGHLWGVKVRGNVTVNIDWRDGSLQRAGFYAEKRTEIQICYKNKVEHRLLEAKTWTYGQW